MPRHPDARVYELSDALVAADAGAAPTTCSRTSPPATSRSPPIVVQVQLANHFRAPRAGAGAAAPRRLARRRRRGDRASRAIPARKLGRAGARAASRARPSGRWRGWPRSSSTCASARCASSGARRDDGERLVLETAARDLLALARGGRPAPRRERGDLACGPPLSDARHPALLARCVVAVNHALGGGAVDQVLQLAGALPRSASPSPLSAAVVEPAEERLDRRAVPAGCASRCSSERRLRFFCCLMFATRASSGGRSAAYRSGRAAGRGQRCIAPAERRERRGRLGRSTAVFAFWTGVSRVAGLVARDRGRGHLRHPGLDRAFVIAFQVPNLLRSLVADSALSAAFVPVFTELEEQGRQRRGPAPGRGALRPDQRSGSALITRGRDRHRARGSCRSSRRGCRPTWSTRPVHAGADHVPDRGAAGPDRPGGRRSCRPAAQFGAHGLRAGAVERRDHRRPGGGDAARPDGRPHHVYAVGDRGRAPWPSSCTCCPRCGAGGRSRSRSASATAHVRRVLVLMLPVTSASG